MEKCVLPELFVLLAKPRKIIYNVVNSTKAVVRKGEKRET